MQDSQIYEKLTTTFHDIFDDKDIQIGPETSASDIENWDSFNHINLVLAIQSSFGIKFSSSELESMENVGEIVTLIQRKLS
jgi:acyl carrier protein